MATFMLCHRHSAQECRSAYAAWHGFSSPLRGRPTLASCRQGGHIVWWTVDAANGEAALKLLPPFVAQRTEVTKVSRVAIP
jgi:hypothetical protein